MADWFALDRRSKSGDEVDEEVDEEEDDGDDDDEDDKLDDNEQPVRGDRETDSRVVEALV